MVSMKDCLMKEVTLRNGQTAQVLREEVDEDAFPFVGRLSCGTEITWTREGYYRLFKEEDDYDVISLAPYKVYASPTDKKPETITDVLNERGRRYGVFSDHANITQRLKDGMRVNTNWERLGNDQRESLEMIAHKIGRILNGDPNYKDSWVDIAGYATLVADTLED